MKIIAGAILIAIDSVMPATFFPILHCWLVTLRAEEFAEMLTRLKEFERLQAQTAKFEAYSPEMAKERYLLEVRLEIVACISSIRRLRQIQLSDDDFDFDECVAYLHEDLADLLELLGKRAKILRIDAAIFQFRLSEIFREHLRLAEAEYNEANQAYAA